MFSSFARVCTRDAIMLVDRPGGIVRKLMSLAVASTAVVGIACGRGKAPNSTAMSADLQRDLQLASATPDIQISPDEVAPQAHKVVAMKPKRAPQGPKVIRTSHPTVRASAKPVEAAETQQQIPQVQVVASTPAPSESPSPDLPPLARPVPIPAQSYPSTAPIPNTGQGGIGAVLGSIFRGAVLGGDGDDCDPRTTRRGRSPYGRPGGIPIGGPGMGGMRVPIMPLSRPR
ncbi:MAG: hypothetical protein ACHQWU_13905 [Gemmatimonadales bacterium]